MRGVVGPDLGVWLWRGWARGSGSVSGTVGPGVGFGCEGAQGLGLGWIRPVGWRPGAGSAEVAVDQTGQGLDSGASAGPGRG